MSNDEEFVYYGEDFEEGTDRDFGTYDREVINGEGYYDEYGKYHSWVTDEW